MYLVKIRERERRAIFNLYFYTCYSNDFRKSCSYISPYFQHFFNFFNQKHDMHFIINIILLLSPFLLTCGLKKHYNIYLCTKKEIEESNKKEKETNHNIKQKTEQNNIYI